MTPALASRGEGDAADSDSDSDDDNDDDDQHSKHTALIMKSVAVHNLQTKSNSPPAVPSTKVGPAKLFQTAGSCEHDSAKRKKFAQKFAHRQTQIQRQSPRGASEW